MAAEAPERQQASFSQNYTDQDRLRQIREAADAFDLAPVYEFEIPGAKFSVFKAKELHNPLWQSDKARQLVTLARDTYKRYGEMPPIDDYDPKSAVFLTKIDYPDESGRGEIEEWGSMRFVPADGEPSVTEDILFSAVRKGNNVRGLWEDIPEESYSHIATISRIAAIRPFYKNDGFVSRRKPNLEGHHLSNRYSGLSFALMNKTFFDEAEANGSRFDIVTGLMHDKLTDRILTYEKKRRD